MRASGKFVVVDRPSAPPPGRMPRVVLLRLAVNSALGIALLAWVRAVTDWGDAVTSVLALGGILSWLGFVGKVFPEERQKQLQRVIAEWLFETPRAWWLTGTLACGFGLTLLFGSVEIENVQGGDAVVEGIYRSGGPEAKDDERLPVGGRLRHLYLIKPWGEIGLEVNVHGLPTKHVELKPWWRTGGSERIVLPGSFLRPVVLVLGFQGTVKDSKTYKLTLIVYVNDLEAYKERYDGRAVLLGNTKADLPPGDRSRDASLMQQSMQVADTLFPAIGKQILLNPSDRVRAELVRDGVASPFLQTQTLRVQPAEGRESVVQLLFLKRYIPQIPE